jgi:DNA-binding GntR family transcriptional regulator
VSGRPWEAGDVAAILVSPFYAIEIHESFSRAHPYVMSEASWITSNMRAIEERGRRQWLEALLSVLRQERTAEALDPPLAMADPYPAITIHRNMCADHEPFIDEADWLTANTRMLEEDGEIWLNNLLSVLKGGYV